MTNIVRLKQKLIDLELMLREKELWQPVSPANEALASTEPFAIDTLLPQEWLQWIFIPRMLTLIAHGQPMPCGFAITPYFAEIWGQESDKQALLALIQEIDEVCQ
ncbi:hypothetical protein CSW98_09980 [Vibrio sp. HA2012]|uniref:YqcC family protein n=1 Tax=Vibrio sp. HA2012 TaxID=1971595 RepID=UPI000C2C3DEB|nr:YqcC family protein [Vibrio sp. HA2012]PJC86526.1 hypothetical protein CSW98_09980 [Vibrio sp. HA2012]